MVSKKTGLVLAGTLVSTSLIGVWSNPAVASSHREAPAISQDPQADNTDVYAFRDVTDPTMLNIQANFIGVEDPNGGPNFVRFSDDVQYSIHVDNNGDVARDITYNFRFRTTIVNPNTFLYNTNQVTSPTDPDLSIRQTYSVEKVSAAGSQMLATDAIVPPVNVGVRSNPQATYESSTAQPTIKPLTGGGKVFAGTREDPFFVDLGSIFDLAALRPIQDNHLIPLPATAGVDGLGGKNVHTIALQVPISSVTAGAITPTVVNNKTSVVGVFASTQRQRVRVLSVDGSSAPRNAGRWVQVSRLGIPLVNEVLIPLGKKDRWNSTDPKDDGPAGFFENILDPEPTKILTVVYPGLFSQANTPRGGAANRPDVVALVTGQLAGLSAANQLPPSDLLRINLASPAGPTAFPNGRRLADDVVDAEIQLFAGVFLDADGIINKLDGTGSSGVPFSALRDGVNATDGTLLPMFPYQGTPFNGFTQRSCNNPAIACPGPGAP